jgi:ssDNA-binding Zn-finger/Zn-ribbon topoisomerase 1
MRCPKCGYISFDYNLECPKCRSDISMEQRKLNLPSFKQSPPFFLGALVGNEYYPVESYFDESPGVGRDGSAKSIGGAAESINGEEDIIFEEAFGFEATEEIQTPSDFSAPPSHFRTQTEEIKDLVSELMPQKGETEADEKMDDIVAGHELSLSREDKRFVTQDQTPEGDFVEGLEELGLDGVDPEGFGSWRDIQQRKRQLADSEGVTREVDRRKHVFKNSG